MSWGLIKGSTNVAEEDRDNGYKAMLILAKIVAVAGIVVLVFLLTLLTVLIVISKIIPLSDKISYQPETNFKKLPLFFASSCALLATGIILSADLNLLRILLLFLCCLIGIFLIYRLNDCIDQDADLRFNIRHFSVFRSTP
ncbi:MAG: hypothetical protein IPM77_14365 [Crocinitomicaceae bacterium]|nr:hypothetical protein [Crocinitomicaceae bacterium]